MAKGLAAAGAQVALVSRTASELGETAHTIGSKASVFPADVSDAADLSRLLGAVEEQLGGGLDIVLHAAGVQHRQCAEEFSADDWNRVINVNLTAPFRLSQEIGKRQLERGQAGSHIFVGSLTSHISLPDAVAYTASKSGIYGVIRNLSTEWSQHGIRVNGIGCQGP